MLIKVAQTNKVIHYFSRCLPISFTACLYSVQALVDTLMLAKYDSRSVAAVGFSNRYLFIGFVVSYALVITAFATKQKDITNNISNSPKGANLKLALTAVTPVTIIMAVVYYFSNIETVLIDNTEILSIAISYIELMALSVPFIASNLSVQIYLFSIDKRKMVFLITIFSITLNILLNFILIYGVWGFPELGARGAALGTVISTIFNFLLFILRKEVLKVILNLRIKIGVLTGAIYKVYKTSVPIIASDIIIFGSIVILFSLYEKIGEEFLYFISIFVAVEGFVLSFAGGLNTNFFLLITRLRKRHTHFAENRKIKLYGMRLALMYTALTAMLITLIFIILSYEPLVAHDINVFPMFLLFVLIYSLKGVNSYYVNGYLRAFNKTVEIAKVEISTTLLIAIPIALFLPTLGIKNLSVLLMLVSINEVVKFWLFSTTKMPQHT